MLPVLFVSGFVGVTLPEEVVDQLVSKRVMVAERQVRVEAAYRTGDPLGSKAEGTLKTLSEPCLIVGHKKTASFRCGGRVAVGDDKLDLVGIEVQVTPVIRLNGKILLDCKITETKIDEGRGLTTPTGFVPGVSTQETKTSALLAPGGKIKVRVSARSAADQTWVELEAKVIEPAGTPAK